MNAHELQLNDVLGHHLVPTTNFRILPSLVLKVLLELRYHIVVDHLQIIQTINISVEEECLPNHISLTAQHIPEVTNTLADWESRVFQDASDWKLNPQIFAALNKLWNPLGIDLCAV